VDTFKDGGLTGITLDPAFTQNGFVYVFYSRLASPVRTRVSRFTASQSNPDIALTGSELILVDDIPADLGRHNGGGLRFGTDGKLYIGVGDGATDPMDAQRLDTLNGKLLRINADGSIPPDNPFVAEPGARPEIWAYGLRNPFTFAIQAGTGAILINDVGRGGWEEINLGAARANYGWPLCEGPCATPGLTDPIHAYPHGIGCALSGAAFYPGGPLPAKYAGAYVYADFMGGWISALEWGAGESTPLAAGLISPVGLSVGNDGALYYLSFTFGTINRIDYRPDAADEANAAGIPLEDLAARAFPCVE
jgi:glucose/arabinose dehydrogenase